MKIIFEQYDTVWIVISVVIIIVIILMFFIIGMYIDNLRKETKIKKMSKFIDEQIKYDHDIVNKVDKITAIIKDTNYTKNDELKKGLNRMQSAKELIDSFDKATQIGDKLSERDETKPII